ncbi:MAG: 3-hydroxyacyl-CoA dehydrogenase NAD-binding domain-containing protein [Anaerolineae bacterium]
MSSPRICVIGPGRIGHGIAAAFIAAGFDVELRDTKLRPRKEEWKKLEAARKLIAESLRLLDEVGAFLESPDAALNRLKLARGFEGVEEARFVFEAVPEEVGLKKEFYEELTDHVAEEAIVASTSSTFSPSAFQESVPDPERFLMTHWLNPAEIIPLVEVVPGPTTREQVVGEMLELLGATGKVPVLEADSPGFICPRLQVLLMNEAVRLIDEGVASAENIDRALKTGLGFRIAIQGIVEFIDWGGVDILHYASNYLTRTLEDERFASPASVRNKIEAGETGMEVRKGFLDYADLDIDALKRERKIQMIELLKVLGLGPAALRAS